jgi:large subunit ribosomal protein L46
VEIPSLKKSIMTAKRIVAATLLTRRPLLVPRPDKFTALYQAYMHDKQHYAPLPVDFYFKKGSVAERNWLDKVAAVEKGIAVPHTEEEENVHRLLQKHYTEHDADVQSLERKPYEHVYLVTKTRQWQLPQGELLQDELLHQAARRNLLQTCGENMSVWYVGRVPVAHHASEESSVFYHKAHILSGQVTTQPAQEWAWLTKEEIKEKLAPQDVAAIQDAL